MYSTDRTDGQRSARRMINCVSNYLTDPVRRALAHSGLIDITTTGRRTGLPRRIEIVFHVFDGRIYISGLPRADRRRSWLANLERQPTFTFHLKGPIRADLPATARVITDPDERARVMSRIIESAWHGQNLAAMVAHSPLVEVTVDGVAA